MSTNTPLHYHPKNHNCRPRAPFSLASKKRAALIINWPLFLCLIPMQ